MPANVGSVKIEISVDDKGSVKLRELSGEAKKAGDTTEQSFSKVGKSADDFYGKLKRAAGVMAAWQVADKLWQTVKAASDLQETTSKFETVFRGQMAVAREFETQLTSAYAMSTQEARKHLAAMQDLLVPMGMNAEAAAKMSGEVVKLAADLGSFNNLPTGQVMGDIQSALVGNYETMKKYGVVLNESTISQKALNLGVVQSKDELTAAQKAQIAYNLIIEGSTFAVGDMNRTHDSFANTMKRLDAAWADITAKMGQQFLPAATAVAEFIAKNLPAAFEAAQLMGIAFVAQINEGWIEIETGVKLLWAAISGSWNSGVDNLRSAWASLIESMASGMSYVPGMGSLAESMNSYAAGIRSSINENDNLVGSIKSVLSERERALDIHNRTVDSMLRELEGHQKTTAAAQSSAAAQTAAQAQVQASVQQSGALNASNVDKWIADVNRIIAAETEKAAKIGELALLEQQFRDQANAVRQSKETEIINRLKFEHDGYLEYRKGQIEKEKAELEALGVSKELIEQNYIARSKALFEEYYAWKTDLDKRYQSDWEAMNREMEAGTQKTVDTVKSKWEDFKKAWGDGTRGNGYIGQIIDAWAKGEDLKVSISETAKSALVNKAGQLVGALWDAMIGKLVQMIGAWIGLGSAESGAEGSSMWERIGKALGFAGSVAGLVGASKNTASGFHAAGGWLAAHPNGGMINQGSGFADDVFLGQTGNVRHWGMGGEFVVNKRSAERYRGLLEQINARYADGGGLKKPYQDDSEGFEKIVDTMMAGGIKTWFESYREDGNIYRAILQTLYYFGQVFVGSFAGKLVGQNWKWADGGLVPDQSGTKPASFFSDLIEAFKRFNKQFLHTINRLFSRLPMLDILGAYANPISWLYTKVRAFLGRDILEEIFDPMRKNVRLLLQALIEPGSFNWKDLLPGSSLAASWPDTNIDTYIENKWKGEHAPKPEQIPQSPTSFRYGGWIPYAGAFASGGMIPYDGVYYGHKGEAVIPAGLVEALTRLSNGGSGAPIELHVHVGNEEFKSYIAHVSDDLRVTAERKGLGTRRYYS